MRLKVYSLSLLALASIFFLIHQTADKGLAADVTTRARVKNDLPRIKIVSPREGATVSGIVKVRAKVSDPAGLAGVKFYVGKNDEGFKDNTNPYTYSWDTRTEPDGNYKLEAQAEYEWAYTASDRSKVKVKNKLSFWENIIQRLKNYWNKSKARLAQVMPVIAIPFAILVLFLLYIFVQRRIDRKSEKLEW